MNSNIPIRHTEQMQSKHSEAVAFEDTMTAAPTNDEYRDEFDLGTSYLINDMDREAIAVFTKLINARNDAANSMALKLAALYN